MSSQYNIPDNPKKLAKKIKDLKGDIRLGKLSQGTGNLLLSTEEIKEKEKELEAYETAAKQLIENRSKGARKIAKEALEDVEKSKKLDKALNSLSMKKYTQPSPNRGSTPFDKTDEEESDSVDWEAECRWLRQRESQHLRQIADQDRQLKMLSDKTGTMKEIILVLKEKVDDGNTSKEDEDIITILDLLFLILDTNDMKKIKRLLTMFRNRPGNPQVGAPTSGQARKKSKKKKHKKTKKRQR